MILGGMPSSFLALTTEANPISRNEVFSVRPTIELVLLLPFITRSLAFIYDDPHSRNQLSYSSSVETFLIILRQTKDF